MCIRDRREHGTGPQWQPGAGGMCLHTIILDPSNPQRMYIAISAAGAFRSDDGGKNWKPINKGLVSNMIPDPTAEVGHCVHHVAMHPDRPGVLFMQKHWDVMRSDDAGDNWREVSGNLPTDFGFAIDVHAHEPETVSYTHLPMRRSHTRATEGEALKTETGTGACTGACTGTSGTTVSVGGLSSPTPVESLAKGSLGSEIIARVVVSKAVGWARDRTVSPRKFRTHLVHSTTSEPECARPRRDNRYSNHTRW